MIHTITNVNDPNKSVMFSNSILGNIFFDTFFGEMEGELSPLADLDKQSKILHLIRISKQKCTIVDSSTCIEVDPNDYATIVSSPTNFCVEITDPNIWNLYFNGSMKKEGVGVRCVLIEPHGNITLLACLL